MSVVVGNRETQIPGEAKVNRLASTRPEIEEDIDQLKIIMYRSKMLIVKTGVCIDFFSLTPVIVD